MATRIPDSPKRASKLKVAAWENNPRNSRRKVRVVRDDETFWQTVRRRAFAFLTHPGFYLPIIILTVGTIAALGYFWVEYSQRVDLLLNGEVYTQSAGIYAAPKTLKVSETISANELVGYLKTANYVDKNQNASQTRGRYNLQANVLTIEPGSDSRVDGKAVFQPLRVTFGKDGKSVASIQNTVNNDNLKFAQLEPKLLSSILGEDGERRKAVKFNDLPTVLIKAITTTEDRAFFEHYGVNLRGIARALWRRVDVEKDDSPIARQGGSSITQQLVKNLLLTNEQSLTRKVQEAYMSIILETRLSKQQIFELYANQIYLGQQASFSINGVGEAANAYFGKDVSALNLQESAFLAGIIRSPNRYNPYKNPERVKERRNQVLDSMVEAQVISAQEAAEAKQIALVLQPPQKRLDLIDTPYFTEYAQSELSKIVADPEAVQHLRIYTTLDADLQRQAHNAVTKRLDRLDKVFKNKPGLNASLVAIRPKTGEIVAMIGGRDYLENQFNRATEAKRQPGSVFKPFVYAAAINTAYDPVPRTITAATVFEDKAKVFTSGSDIYKPNNYGDFFSNKEVTVRDALVKSKNTITVDLAMELNIGKVMNLAAKAGLPKVAKAYPSMALGTAEATPLEMATAYTTFANLGQKTQPTPISRVTTGDGTTVAAPAAQKTDVLRSDVAFVMNDMMKDVVNRGTAAELRAWGFKNVPNKTAIAGKTGTSRDGWFAGFTPDLVCVVYVGFDNGDDLGMKGSDSAMPIWADFMKAALDSHPEWNGDWAMPAGVEKAEIDIRNGKLIAESEAAENAATENAVAAPTASPATTTTILSDGTVLETPNPDSSQAVQTVGVPAEFRRTELFLSGTLPHQTTDYDESASGEPETLVMPEMSPTPEITYDIPKQVYIEPSDPRRGGDSTSGGGVSTTAPTTPAAPSRPQHTVILQICPTTNLIAAPSCPTMRARTFKMGNEPTQFCSPQNHRN